MTVLLWDSRVHCVWCISVPRSWAMCAEITEFSPSGAPLTFSPLFQVTPLTLNNTSSGQPCRMSWGRTWTWLIILDGGG